MGADQTFFPNLANRYDVRDPRAHDHPVIDRYQRLYAALGGGPPGAADDPAQRAAASTGWPTSSRCATCSCPRASSRDNPGAVPRAWVAHWWQSGADAPTRRC